MRRALTLAALVGGCATVAEDHHPPSASPTPSPVEAPTAAPTPSPTPTPGAPLPAFLEACELPELIPYDPTAVPLGVHLVELHACVLDDGRVVARLHTALLGEGAARICGSAYDLDVELVQALDHGAVGVVATPVPVAVGCVVPAEPWTHWYLHPALVAFGPAAGVVAGEARRLLPSPANDGWYIAAGGYYLAGELTVAP